MPDRYAQLTKSERRVIDDIRAFGWHGVWVEEDAEQPNFNYSVGFLDTLQHAEIIIFGLPRKVMHEIMWEMFRDIQSGRRFEEPALYDGLIERFACAVRPVHPTQHRLYLGYALWYLRWLGAGRELKAVQLFWPGKDGLFPWELGCSSVAVARQPLLYLPAADSGKA